MIALIDNYDSFSYNLYQMIGEFRQDIKVLRNDELTVAELSQLNPEKIILSPGPKAPKDAGICLDICKQLSKEIPILGVCLGHQTIFEAFGGTISYAKKIFHGKPSNITFDNKNPLFKGIDKKEISVARYHSLSGVLETLPNCLEIIATTKDDDCEIMAIAHKEYKTYGVQFHPESILTPDGSNIIKNFLDI